MSRRKRWTEQAAAARAAARPKPGPKPGAAPAAGSRRRRSLAWAVKLVAVFAAAFAVTVLASRPSVPFVLATVMAATVTAGSAAYMVLARRVGPLTAVPAVALLVGALAAAAVYAAPHCPGLVLPSGQMPGRCAPADTANWALSAMLCVVVVAAMTRLPYRAARHAWVATRRLVAWVRDRRY